jgi:hypothetical protein
VECPVQPLLVPAPFVMRGCLPGGCHLRTMTMVFGFTSALTKSVTTGWGGSRQSSSPISSTVGDGVGPVRPSVLSVSLDSMLCMANTEFKAFDWLPTDDVCEFGERIEERTVRTYLASDGHRDRTEERCCPKCDPLSASFVPPDDM